MPTFNSMAAGRILIAQAVSSAATAGVVTIAAPADPVRNANMIFGLIVSGTVAPGGVIAVLLADAGVTVLTLEIPATTGLVAGPFVYNFPAGHPYVTSGAVTLTVPSLGGAGVSCGAILYAIGTAN
jgi:hypothetical protein